MPRQKSSPKSTFCLPIRLLIAALAFLLAAGGALASVTLAWDPNLEPDVAGYRLYYGAVSGTYSQMLDVGPATVATIAGLDKDTPYYFVVTAINLQGQESAPSDEVMFELSGNEPPIVQMQPTGEFNRGTPVQLSAFASDMDGVVAKVEFYRGSEKLGEANSAPFSATWEQAPAGNHEITAIAYDDAGASSASEELRLAVKELAIGAMERLPDGSCQFRVTGAVGKSNRIYASTDLVNWTLVATEVNYEGTLVVTDPEAADLPSRFYKVQAD
jgi:hypothetical protein